MSIQLQALLIVGALVFFAILLKSIKKSSLSTDLASVWILFGIGIILIAIFPEIVYFITKILGIIAPINAVFLILISTLILIIFYLFLKISIMEDKIKNLVQYISLNDKESK